jgi:hypothetical protein
MVDCIFRRNSSPKLQHSVDRGYHHSGDHLLHLGIPAAMVRCGIYKAPCSSPPVPAVGDGGDDAKRHRPMAVRRRVARTRSSPQLPPPPAVDDGKKSNPIAVHPHRAAPGRAVSCATTQSTTYRRQFVVVPCETDHSQLSPTTTTAAAAATAASTTCCPYFSNVERK